MMMNQLTAVVLV